jgi:hypothetical protein
VPNDSTAPTGPAGVPGEIALACDDPLPGHCLQDIAYAVQQLDPGIGSLSAVTASSINLCPTASPCIGPPHRGETWVTFTFRDGAAPIGEWIVNMLGIPSVQSISTGVTPPPSTNPATAQFRLACQGEQTDIDCIGAAAGATALAPPQPVGRVTVAPASATCGPPSPCPSIGEVTVEFRFTDGTSLTVRVGRDPVDPNGWSPVGGPVPTPTR